MNKRKDSDNAAGKSSAEKTPIEALVSPDGVVVEYLPGEAGDPAHLDEKWVQGVEQAKAEAAAAAAAKAAAEAEVTAAVPELILAAEAEAKNAAEAAAAEAKAAEELAERQLAIAKGEDS